MAILIKYWNGNIRGTNTGKIHLKITNQTPEYVIGTLHINDDVLGLSIYKLSGIFKNSVFEFTGEWDRDATPAIQSLKKTFLSIGKITCKATLIADGTLIGEWESTIGTAGTFNLFPDNISFSADCVHKKQEEKTPTEKLISQNVKFGVLRLSIAELKDLLNKMKEKFVSGNILITYPIAGRDTTEYVDDFLMHLEGINNLNTLKIFAQERDTASINKVLSIQLGSGTNNFLHIEAASENWVIGECEIVGNILKQAESKSTTLYKKVSPYINLLVLITIIVILPSIENIWVRTLISAPIFSLIFIVSRINERLIPIFQLYSKERPVRSWLKFGWAFTIINGVVTAAIIHFFKLN